MGVLERITEMLDACDAEGRTPTRLVMTPSDLRQCLRELTARGLELLAADGRLLIFDLPVQTGGELTVE